MRDHYVIGIVNFVVVYPDSMAIYEKFEHGNKVRYISNMEIN
jgi:hypothetical protein